MCVGAVGAVGSGGGTIDPLLMERYAVLNRDLRLKRLREEGGIEPIGEIFFPEVKEVEPPLTVEEIREIYANPISKRIPIKIAYTVLQRLCDETLRMSQNTDYLKPIALRMYGG
jgi:hypothetical protein